MTLLTPAIPTTRSLAQQQAERNFANNLSSLQRHQPKLAEAVRDARSEVHWVFGRDGSLTAQDFDGKWWAGCSIPRRAAAEVLKRISANGTIACILAPTHAAQVAYTLERLKRTQGLIAILPDDRDLWVMLHCHDFTTDFDRLWFLAGANWEVDLKSLLEEQHGISIPAQFVRLNTTPPDQVDSMVKAAQAVFSALTAARSDQSRAARGRFVKRPGGVKRLCVVAPSRFRLWDNAGEILRAAVREAGVEVEIFDPDCPSKSSPLAFTQIACECDAVLSPNTARADLPNLTPDDLPWITWATSSRIPQFKNPLDRLIVTTQSIYESALAAGWGRDAVHVGNWPAMNLPAESAEATIGLIADTTSLETPADLKNFSSQRLLWEAIRDELTRDPFRLSSDLNAYLSWQMDKIGIAADTIDRARFIDALIAPAFQQGLARSLIDGGIAIRIWGAGWADPAFASHWAGEFTDSIQLTEAVGACSSLVHAWPIGGPHAIDQTCKPLVRALGRRREQFLDEARRSISGHSQIVQNTTQTLDSGLISRVLATLC